VKLEKELEQRGSWAMAHQSALPWSHPKVGVL